MRSILLLICCALLFCCRAYAQDSELFTTVAVDETKLKLDEGQRTRIEKTKKNKLTKKTAYAQVGDLSKLISQGQLTFTMPGAGKVTAKTRHLDARSKSNYKYIGSIDGERFGSVYLYNRDGEISGDIRIDDRSFHLKPAGKDLVLIAETDVTELRGGVCKYGPEEKKPKQSPNGGRVANCPATSKARILVLYTQAAVNEYGLAEVQHRATVAVDQFNYAKWTSQVQNSRAELQLVGIELTSWQETQNMPNTDAAINQEIFSLRNTAVARQVATNSDIVVCITNGHYQDKLAGIAKTINVFFAEDAYALVEMRWMGEAANLAHEVGHLYGGDHERPNSNTPGDAHGYAFGVNFGLFNLGFKSYSTIMYSTFTIGDTDTRELTQWSNPDVRIYDKPTGVNGYSNMARVIASRADYMADLRPPVPGALHSGISGNEYISCQGTYTFHAEVSCGLEPYNYNWEVSSDGFYYNAISNSDACSLYFANGTGYQRRYLRLTVTSGDGQTSISTFEIDADMNYNCYNGGRKSAEPIGDFNLEIESAYPNPAQTDLKIKVTLPSHGHTTLDLLDLQGKPVTVVHEGELDAGVHTFAHDVSGLPAGTYLLKAQSLQQIKTAKIQIVR